MEMQIFVILNSALVVFSLLLCIRYFRHFKLLENIPTSKIRSAAQGYVELTGTARPDVGPAFHAPGANKPCVWFEYGLVQGEGNSRHVTPVATSASFLVDDGTGTVRINPFELKVETRHKKSFPLAYDIAFSRWIAEGDKVHVYGKFDTLRWDYHRLFNELVNSRLSSLKKDKKSMMALDHNGDGVIDADEWNRGAEQVKRDVKKYIDELQKKHRDNLVSHRLRPPDDKKFPYLVTSSDELKTIRYYKLYAAGWFFIFLLSAYVLFYNYIL